MRTRPRSRRSRRNVELLKKAGIWLFLACFVASVVGVALIAVSR